MPSHSGEQYDQSEIIHSGMAHLSRNLGQISKNAWLHERAIDWPQSSQARTLVNRSNAAASQGFCPIVSTASSQGDGEVILPKWFERLKHLSVTGNCQTLLSFT
jgi:hypothetical protein